MSSSKDKQSTYGPYTHVIFDMDGLLLNTESLYTVVYETVAAKYGKKYTWEMKQQLMGRPTIIGAKMSVELMNLPITPEEFVAESQKVKDEIFPTASLLPGAEKLVRHLANHKVPIALASGSATRDYENKTVNHKEFFDLFPIKILGDNPNLKHGKPAPDQFLLTSSYFSDKPANSEILVFEDSPNGILAAKAAGMGVILVPDERLDKTLYHDPTLAINSLEKFQPELFGLPPFKN